MLFDVNAKNLKHLRAAVKQYGEAWIHGCGNIYVDKGASDFRKDFSNPTHTGGPSAPKYRAHFTSVNDVPDTPEELEKVFLANAQKEMKDDARKQNNKSDLKFLESDEPAEAPVEAKEPEMFVAKRQQLTEWEQELAEDQKTVHDAMNKLSTKEKEVNQRYAELDAREKDLKAQFEALKSAKPVAEAKAAEPAKDKK